LNHLNPYQHVLQTVASHIPSDSKVKVLDAACGTGNFESVFFLSHNNHKHNVVGIDASKEMLLRAKEKHHNHQQVSFVFGDLNQKLSFVPDDFDYVVSINTLYAIADPLTLLCEFFRVLKIGGRLLLVTPKRNCQNGLILKEHCGSQKPDSYWLDIHTSQEKEESLIREAIFDPQVIDDMLMVGKYNKSICSTKSFHFFSLDDLESLLGKAGFSIVSSSEIYAKQAFFIHAVKP
jgi:ubiquinone/menaquinone biosynthesis C-methylase UbiE